MMTATAVTGFDVSTLGQTRLEGTLFSRPKAVAFLTYLLLEGRQTRQFMADLFWADAADSLSSLRNQIMQLKPVVGAALKVTRQFIEFEAGCDALELLRQLEAGQFETAIALYQGDFLADFQAPKDSDLVLWVRNTRLFLQRQILEAHLHLCELALRRMDLPRIQSLLLAAKQCIGADNRGLAQWFLQRQTEFETRVEALNAKVAVHNLPLIHSEFIGRDQEISAILERLSTQAQLITLFGFGGLGKTRLALETARTALLERQYTDGIYFVALEAALTENDLLTRLVITLEMPLQTSQPLLEQLKNFIASKSMLLVLDNLEQLTEQTHVIAELLEGSPNLRLICTSREVLGLSTEHVYPITGLDTSVINAGAVQLFTTRAATVFSKQDLESILKIVRTLQGIPLAIELAVPQLTTQSLAELQVSLESSMDVLEQNNPDLPMRQRSLRAVFLYSWNRLSQPERQALQCMGVFKSGANRNALFKIADISLSQIANLMDKSFVQRNQQRYTIHPLILEYTLEMLRASPEFEPMVTQHAKFYLDMAGGQLPQIRGAQAASIMQTIEADFDNLKIAWAWALEKKDFDRISALEEMVVYFDQKALFFQGIEFFEDANSKLKEVANQPLALGGIAIGIAWLHFRLGNAEKATFYGEYAVKCAKSEPELGKNNLSKAYNILGNTAIQDYEYLSALKYFHQAIRCCDVDHLKIRQAIILLAIAGIYRELEDFDGFWNSWESARKLNSQLHLDNIKVLLTIEKANFLLYYVSKEEICQFIPELTNVYYSTKITSVLSQPYFEIILAQFYFSLKDLTNVEFWLQKFILRDMSQINPSLYLFSQSLLGRIEILKGHRNTARTIFAKILYIKFERQNILALFIILVYLIDLIPIEFRNDFKQLIKLVIAHKAMTNQRLLTQYYLQEVSLHFDVDAVENTSDQQIEATRQSIVDKLRTTSIYGGIS